jgi:hypothetical protein
MIKKAISFMNFDDEQVVEEHYFHLSKIELIDMIAEDEDLGEKLEAIAKSGDTAKIMSTFRDIIGKAYGQRDPVNASKFFKSAKITDEFMGSLAFDALFSELLTDATAAAQFIMGIVPKDLANMEEMTDAITSAGLPDPNGLDKAGAWPRTITDAKLESYGPDIMTPERAVVVSGLKMPRDAHNKFLPWALRKPTDQELTAMTKAQLLDVMRRSASGWEPPIAIS